MTAAFSPSLSRRSIRPLASNAPIAGLGHSPYGTLGSHLLLSCVFPKVPKTAPLMVAPREILEGRPLISRYCTPSLVHLNCRARGLYLASLYSSHSFGPSMKWPSASIAP